MIGHDERRLPPEPVQPVPGLDDGVAGRVRPARHHGEQPVEEGLLDAPVPIGSDQQQGGEAEHVGEVGRDAVQVVDDHPAEPDQAEGGAGAEQAPQHPGTRN